MDSSTVRVAFWQASLASTTTSSLVSGELGDRSKRISPDAWHSGEREVLGVEVESKRRRVEGSELETVDTVDPE